MAVASVWRRRWPWRRVSSSTAPQVQLGGHDGGDAEGFSLQPSYGYGGSTTSGTTYTNTTTTGTGTSNSGGEEGLREFHLFTTTGVLTAPVVEEDMEELDVAREIGEDRAKKMEHIKSLVAEFRGSNLSAVERWLSELDVGWVLHFPEAAESTTVGIPIVFYSKSWILALHEISESISICSSSDGWCSQHQQQDQAGTSKHVAVEVEHPAAAAAASEFARLVEATVLKMLPFVDIAVSTPTHTHRPGAAAEEKLQVLIDLHEALSTASEQHILPSLTDDCTTTRALLSAYLTRLGKAIWVMIVEIRNSFMASLDGRGVDPSDSMGIVIHEATRSVTSYAKLLWRNHGQMNRILDDAVRRGEHVCFDNENVSYLTNLIIDMVRSLEEQLATNSQSWFSADLQGLRFLFLVNNCYFVFQELQASSQLLLHMLDLARKIEDYIDCYVQVSWASVLKCLQALPPATPRCFTRYYSPPLRKFVSRLQKTYAAQKLWKVPDPEMRKRLRKTIVDGVVPVFARFLEDNSIDDPGVVTPRKVENMLGELFEG